MSERDELAKVIYDLTKEHVYFEEAELADAIIAAGFRKNTYAEVLAERERQEEKWGEQNHPNGTAPGEMLFNSSRPELAYSRLREAAIKTTDDKARNGWLTYADIFLEEVFEAMAEKDPEKLRVELIQCAAVAVAWVEKVDRDTVREHEGGAA